MVKYGRGMVLIMWSMNLLWIN